MEIIEDASEEYATAIEELREVASTTSHDAVRVGAIKARLSAKEAQLGLLQSVGVLPRDLGHVRVEADVRYVMERIIKVSASTTCR